MVSRRPFSLTLLIVESMTIAMVFGHAYLDPRVNPANIQIIDNTTNSAVTTITDVEYVYLRYNASVFNGACPHILKVMESKFVPITKNRRSPSRNGNYLWLGVTLFNIRACDDDLCSNYDVQLMDSNGCPVEFAGLGKVIGSGFVRDSANAELYETTPFKLFRWDNGKPLILKGQKDICETAAAICNDKCTASSGRRKRDVTPTRTVQHFPSSYKITGKNGKECTINFNTDTVSEHMLKERNDVNGLGYPAQAVHRIRIEWTENQANSGTVSPLFKTYFTNNGMVNDELLQAMRILKLLTFLVAAIATVLTFLRILLQE